MANIDIMILYEHVQRELKSACILKVLLENEGYSVKIVNVAWRKGLLNLLYKPKLIISPSCQNNLGMDYIVHNFVGAYNGGYKILNLYSEQLSPSSAEDVLAIKEKALQIYHIAWGEYTYQNLLNYGLSQQQIKITGSQRLDYTKEVFKSLNVAKDVIAEKFGLNLKKKWIMMVGNFTAKDEPQKEFNRIESEGYHNFKEIYYLTKKTYYELINWYETILNDETLKDKFEFIYRPHPNELLDNKLTELSKKYKNFHIIGELTISDWALNIDLVYTWTSTSSVEFAVAKVPIISLMPFKLPKYHEMPLVNKLKTVRTIDELMFMTKDIFTTDGCDINNEFYDATRYYYYLENDSASKSIVDFVKIILNDDKNIVKSEFNIFKGIIKMFVFFIEYILFALRISPNKYLAIRFRDVRTQKYIENYCQFVRKKLYG